MISLPTKADIIDFVLVKLRSSPYSCKFNFVENTKDVKSSNKYLFYNCSDFLSNMISFL